MLLSVAKSLCLLFKNHNVLVLATVLLFLIPIISVASAQQDVSCYHCHTTVVHEFRNNIHYKLGFSCANCHGGIIQPNASVVSIEVMSGDS